MAEQFLHHKVWENKHRRRICRVFADNSTSSSGTLNTDTGYILVHGSSLFHSCTNQVGKRGNVKRCWPTMFWYYLTSFLNQERITVSIVDYPAHITHICSQYPYCLQIILKIHRGGWKPICARTNHPLLTEQKCLAIIFFDHSE